MDVVVARNDAAQRYEARLGDELVGVADYERVGDVVVIPRTVVDPAMRGRGIAAQLVSGALDDIRATGATVDPRCSYVAEFIARQPAYADMVAGR